MQTAQIDFLRLLLMLSSLLADIYPWLIGICTSRLGVWLHQPGKGRDSWPHGMGQAETDGPDRPGWRGDRWQHGTARKGGHMATWDWQEHKSLRWAQLQAWWVWICLGESKTAFTSFDSSSDRGWDPVDCRMRPRLCAVFLDRDVSHCMLLSLSFWMFFLL